MTMYMEKFASIIVDHSTKIKKDDVVSIDGPIQAVDLLEEVYRQVIDRGAHPLLLVTIPGTNEYLLKHGSKAQLSYLPPYSREKLREMQATISILAETNLHTLANVAPDNYTMYLQPRRELKNIRYEMAAAGKLKWCLALYPTDAYAQRAGMSLMEFRDILFKACFLDMDNPIEGWESVHELNNRVEKHLRSTDKIRIVAEETDLTLSIKGRPFDNCFGQVNLPDGEVATAPIENSANGYILFTYPFYNDGRQIDRIQLVFENGKVVEAESATNCDYLNKMLDVDKGARYLGEIGFGTNYHIPGFLGNLLLDEKLGGSIHLALGNAYPSEGGTNVSAIHWDLILDLRTGGEVYTDGNLFIRNGEFLFK